MKIGRPFCASLLLTAQLVVVVHAPAWGTPKAASSATALCSVAVSGDEARALVRAEAERQGIDPKLAVAVLEQESRAGLDLNSSAGARGPMQLMPATAERFGVKDICDARENMRGGIAYLKDLLAEFGGDVLLALAAYNSGEERVYQARGIPPIGETVRYVAAIANSYYGYRERLATKRAARSAAAINSPSDTSNKDAGSVVTDGGTQKWIGGSVLYVEQGDE